MSEPYNSRCASGGASDEETDLVSLLRHGIGMATGSRNLGTRCRVSPRFSRTKPGASPGVKNSFRRVSSEISGLCRRL